MSNPYPNCQWQHLSNDAWAFGEKVRGIIRNRLAEVYFSNATKEHDMGWIWYTKGRRDHGLEPKIEWAIQKAEAALGIKG